jgi:DNA-binding CsgD family transcriptional regulator
MLSEALLQLYARCGSKEFPQSICRCLEIAFPGSVISIDEVFHNSGESMHHLDNRDFAGSYPGVAEGFRLYSHQHPSVRYYLEGGKEPIIFLGDLASFDEFRKLEIYRHVFKPFGIRDQITMVLPSSGSSAYGASINLNRKATSLQRKLARSLYPHLAQAQENATLGLTMTLFDLPEKFHGVQIPIRDRVEIGNWPAQARELLDLFFDRPEAVPWQPPAKVLEWMKQRRQIFDRTGTDWRKLDPLLIVDERGSLHINLTYAPDSKTEILLLSGRLKKAAQKVERGEMTKREREIVSWITEGKSNAEIASILSISIPTVKKHLENIFVKIGVENRMALALFFLQSRK